MTEEAPRVSTGGEGLDDILGGGLDPSRLYLYEDRPGTGKTTIALQFLLDGVKKGERVLYITLSETERDPSWSRDATDGRSTGSTSSLIFEPFFTTKEIGRGSGLGLAQVYGFAKQSGGTVRIDTEVGKGTSITLFLPRSHKAPRPADRNLIDLTVARQPTSSKCAVLLVEDDEEVAVLVAQMLQHLGYEVTRAASATAALGALANGRSIDLVLSDIMMPGDLNGVELAREVQRRRRGLPVLLTSGYAEAAAGEAQEIGVRILPKPYRIDDLRAALDQALASAA